MQAIASGSDTVQYFQWRKGRGSYEQYHGAVVDHLGTDDTRVFREVAEVGTLLRQLPELAGTTVHNEAALLFDWDNRWAIEDVMALSQETKQYEKTCMELWKAMMKLGVEADVISSDCDFSKYKVILAPMLYLLHPGTADKLKSFVAQGGQLLATYFTGYVDENQLCYLGGFPGDGLSEVFGVISEEIDTLYPTDRNHIVFSESNQSCPVYDYAEVLRVAGAQVLASYQEDYYAATPAVTCNHYGTGDAVYVACRISGEDMQPLLRDMLQRAGLPTKELPAHIEYHVRSGETGTYEFYLNASTQPVTLPHVTGYELLTGVPTDGPLTLPEYGVAVLRK
jgi:beta-galactosidase